MSRSVRFVLPFVLGLLAVAVTTLTEASETACTRTFPELPLPVMLDHARIPVVEEIDLDGVGGKELVALFDEGGERPEEEVDGGCSVQLLEIEPGPRLEALELFRLESLPGRYDQPQLVTGDVDGNGLVDLMIWRRAGGSSVPSRLDLFLHKQENTFAPGPAILTGYSYIASAGDYDGDGQDEVVLFVDRTARLYRYADESGWQLVTAIPVAWIGSAVSADFDQDGDDDLVGIDWRERWLWRLYGDPTNPLAGVQTDRLSYTPRGNLTLFNGDGEGPPDIVIKGITPWHLEPLQLHGLRVGPLGTELETLWSLIPSDGLESWSAWDFDRDGRDDLALGYRSGGGSGYPPREGESIDVYFGRGDGAPVPGPRTIGAPNLAALRDLTGDGVLDAIVRTAPGYRGLAWYPGLGPGHFEEPDRYLPNPHHELNQLFTADFDLDGTQDLLGLRSYGDAYLRPLRGLGDGQFVAGEDLPIPWVINKVLVHDIDTDGFVDVIVLNDDTIPYNNLDTHVAYGRGDGSFEPFVDQPRPSGPLPFFNMIFGDLDGDGDDDFIGDDYYGDQAWVPYYIEGRQWRRGRVQLALREHDFLHLLDLDQDGLDDLIYEHTGPWPERVRHLAWRPSLSEGGFGVERRLFPLDESMKLLSAVDLVDFDGDDTGDLFVQFDQGTQQLTRVLQGLGQGQFRTLWQETVPWPRGGQLLDFDGDGHLDIVSRSPGLRYWPGDGSGRFRLERGETWYAEPEPLLADFTGNGSIDLLTLYAMAPDPVLALSRHRPRLAAADLEPPEVEIWLHPLAADLELPPKFNGQWRVVTTMEDRCDAAPQALARRLDLVDLPATTPVLYRPGEASEFRIYQLPETGQQLILLVGPDEAELRGLLAAAQADGGFDLEPIALLRLSASGHWGPGPEARGDDVLVPRSYRLSRRFAFEDGALAGASINRPDGDLTFTAIGADHAGKQTTAHASLRAAQAEYCARPDALDVICDPP